MQCQAILSGISAGGLATILNCDKFKCLIPENARVKCIADAGFFINGLDLKKGYFTSSFNKIYLSDLLGTFLFYEGKQSMCFFPQNVVPFVQTPLFIINSIYDYWQNMPPKRTNERETKNKSAPHPVQPDSLDEHVSHAEFRTIFTTLSSSVIA
ncbi:hypothetical protein CQW23_30730 [Capsicum baccatum]|uniref:Pectin acetylesterase n=1 Tax=Capsicum baccatum TaxID=33114 RepID=A0A2G2V9M6_CAPBA|nr:hypothetical protein CQW23_30730 [Capsicum baccatum]